MNRYQLEVAQMDRRHRLVVRSLSFLGAGILTVCVLWSAGLPPSMWFTRVWEWLDRDAQQAGVAKGPPGSRGSPIGTPQGEVAAPPDAARGTDSSASDIPQPLYLAATFPGKNAREGTARLGTEIDNPQTYGAGAILANGAQLAEIHNDHVVLTKDGQSAKLYLKGKARTNSELVLIGGAVEVAPTTPMSREILTDYLRPNPVFSGDVLVGYEVYPGARPGPFSQWGLQGGDVITAIDGQPLTEPVSAVAALRQIAEGIAVVATIDRKGKRQQVTLDGALISSDQARLQAPESVANAAAPFPPG